MGVRIISDGERAAFYDSVTGRAFGPVIEGFDGDDPGDLAAAFLADWSREWTLDIRQVSSDQIEAALSDFLTVRNLGRMAEAGGNR